MDILKRSGHQVRHFEDGSHAWAHLKENPDAYDLLIIDVNLPGMNGIEIVAKAREHNFPGRIFMVSGRFTSSDMVELTRLKIDHALTKDVYKRQGLQLPLAAATRLQFERLVGLGLGGLDKSGVAELTFKGRHA